MAEFCRQRGPAYATVAAWRSGEWRRAGGFVEVEAPAQAGAAENAPVSGAALCAELLLPGGAVRRVYHRAGEGGAR